MLGRANEYAKVETFGVRVKDRRQKDPNHLIEVGFEVSLTHELADLISPQMARDLFQSVKGEWVPKAEMNEAGFTLSPGTQVMTIRTHPDLDPMFRVSGVSIRKIKAKKGESNAWSLCFTVQWVLGADVELTTIVRAIKSGIFLTLEDQEPSMLDPGMAPSDDKTASVNGAGVVESIDSGRKKRRRRSPEAEAAEQATHGAQVGDVPDAAEAQDARTD